MTIHSPTPGLGCFAQRDSIPDSTLAHALAREQTDRNLGLVQPASMLGRVVDCESTPQPAPSVLAEPFDDRLPGMGTQIVHHQMNSVGVRIADGGYDTFCDTAKNHNLGKSLNTWQIGETRDLSSG
jgi:hypothetical protein